MKVLRWGNEKVQRGIYLLLSFPVKKVCFCSERRSQRIEKYLAQLFEFKHGNILEILVTNSLFTEEEEQQILHSIEYVKYFSLSPKMGSNI